MLFRGQDTEFRFTNGEKLPELRIHYRTVGKPAVVSGEIQNAILLLHGTSGTGAAILAEGSGRRNILH
jgi:homoserine O-acetyltransferase/O-succinyltransferase